MTANEQTDLAALDALDLLDAAFTGDTDRFVALLPTDLDAVELLLVAVVEQAQQLVEFTAPKAAHGFPSAEESRLWLSLVLNVQRLKVCGFSTEIQVSEASA